jgi:hypothetical protein
LVAWPYGFVTYRRLMKQSTSMSDLQHLHGSLHRRSRLFKLLRPRYHIISRLLHNRL